jgi:hypothetical protein
LPGRDYCRSHSQRIQNKPARHVDKNPDLHFRLVRAEADIDACIDQKLAEWAAVKQPELKGVSRD